MSTEDALQAILDANPDDHTTRLILADWLQEYGDPRADGYRALGSSRLRPHYRASTNAWFWASRKSEWWRDVGTHLPDDWFDCLSVRGKSHYFAPSFAHRSDREDPASRHELENAAALAFAKLSPERRAALLNPELVPA